MSLPRQLEMFDGSAKSLCPLCRFRSICGAEGTAHECPPGGRFDVAGPESLSLSSPRLARFEQALTGLALDDVQFRQPPGAHFHAYLPEIKYDSNLRGIVDRPFFAVRLPSVFGRRGEIRSAVDVLNHLRLSPATKLVLVCTVDDDLLEEFEMRSPRILGEIAKAGYWAVVGPSFSTYDNRDRPEYLVSIKRSLVTAQVLAVPTVFSIPCIGVNIPADVRRVAAWLRQNNGVHTIAVDLMNEMKQLKNDTLPLLSELPQLVGRRIGFVVVGPASGRNFEKVFTSLGTSGITITNAGAAAGAPRVGSTKHESYDFLVDEQIRSVHEARTRIENTTQQGRHSIDNADAA